VNTKPCVFIVDDDDAIRDGLSMVFETVGLAYHAFENAEHFFESYIPGTPGCLILDINMKGMNGDELQKELNRRNIQLPIIFLSSYGDNHLRERVINAGTVDFMAKPVQINLLIERIQLIFQPLPQVIELKKVE
jgi:FixJ family two-component response regulator